MIRTEDEAQKWMAEILGVPRGTLERLDAFAAFLAQENERQNLIAGSTVAAIWVRHIADSAQLVLLASDRGGAWLDIGSGAGFPGLIVAALHPVPVTLVEPRKLRADFLHRAADILGVQPTIVAAKVERLASADGFGVISARAFASLEETLQVSHPFSTEKTRWILPKGRHAQSELEAAHATWHGDFRLVPSLTDADASIVVAERVRPRVSSGRQRKPR